MVRPTMEPANSPASFCFILAGSSQLLVGPASSLVREQMKVWSSTRATSAGSERTRKLLGRFDSSSGMAVPVRTSSRSIAWYSSGEPSHQWTRSGLHICAASSTQRPSLACLGLLAGASTSIVVVAMMVNVSRRMNTDTEKLLNTAAAASVRHFELRWDSLLAADTAPPFSRTWAHYSSE